MSTAETSRCPACWSAVGAEDDRCAECGQVIRAPNGRWLLPAAAVALIGIGGALWWGLFHDNRAGPSEPEISREPPPGPAHQPRQITGDVPATAPDNGNRKPAPQPPQSLHLFRVRGNERWVGLLRVAPATPGGGALLCVPLDLLPRRGPLTTGNGDEIDADVITVDWQRLLVLLAVPASAVAGRVALRVGPAATLTTHDRLEVRDPRWSPDKDIGLTAPLGGAIELKLDARLPEGAVLMFDDHAVAYGLGGTRALPLDPLLPWLRRATTRLMTLAELQKQLRSKDPQLILEDAGALLGRRPATMKRVEEALTMLEHGQHLARDAASMEAFAHLLAQAHHQRVRVQSRTDQVQALILAKEALLRFPNHAGILADAVLLSVSHGDPADAATLYQQLLQVSPEHARNVADDVAAGLQRAARSRQRGNRNQEALVLLARAVQLFPQRADMHLAYAKALAAAGLDYDALAAANEAARLDPSYSRHLARYQRAANDGGRSRTYIIPYDPKTRAIKTQASVSGQPVRLIVDTGSSLTTIPTALADRLGLRKKTNPRTKVTTASGVMEVEVVELASLKLGKISVRKVQAAVLDLPGEGLANTGLLGLNVLQRLNMQIDTEKSRLILRQSRKRR